MTVRKRTFPIGPGVDCDLDRLISTRLLVQANSGGGKSWLLRRLLEQTHGKVQQIVIDPEGEFATLRQKFDYVLAARQGGDTLADPRTAKLLAERLLELGVSAIVDIYELYPRERIQFVKLFCEALVNAPKALWHPVLVVLDEAHVFCPEREEAESATAVSALCSLGRKRGFCAVLATQRISKLAKDAAAECNNKLTGRTSLDVDMKRAAEDLGFTDKQDKLALRDLEDGEFFVYGPAFKKGVQRVQVGPVQTEHPKAGSHLAAVVPPPTDKVKALLPKLSDLPAEAEAREKTTADLKRDLANVRRELTEAKKAQPPAPKAIEGKRVAVLTDADRAMLEKLDGHIARLATALDVDVAKLIEDIRVKVASAVNVATTDMLSILRRTDEEAEERLHRVGFQKILGKLATVTSAAAQHTTPTTNAPRNPLTRRVAPALAPATSSRPARQVSEGETSALNSYQRKFLAVLAQFPEGCAKGKLMLLSGYRWSGGAINALSDLRTRGFIEGRNTEVMRITQAGIEAIGNNYEPLPTGKALIEYWINNPNFGSYERKFLRALTDVYPNGLSKEELLERTGYRWSGGVINALSAMRTAGVIVGRNNEVLRASEELFS